MARVRQTLINMALLCVTEATLSVARERVNAALAHDLAHNLQVIDKNFRGKFKRGPLWMEPKSLRCGWYVPARAPHTRWGSPPYAATMSPNDQARAPHTRWGSPPELHSPLHAKELHLLC